MTSAGGSCRDRGCQEFANRFLGRGEATITVPSFDGALKPNQKLEAATTLLEGEALEDLATDGRKLYVADGHRLLRLDGSAATELRSLRAADLGALCARRRRHRGRARRPRRCASMPIQRRVSRTSTFSDAAFNADQCR